MGQNSDLHFSIESDNSAMEDTVGLAGGMSESSMTTGSDS